MESTKTKKELLEEIKQLKDQVERLDRYKQYENAATEMRAMHEAFVNSGFTDEQAFDLVKTLCVKSMKGL